MKTAHELVPSTNVGPRTHRIGWSEIADLARALREIADGDVDYGLRLLEATLESIDPRWRSV